MKRSDLITLLAERFDQLTQRDVKMSVEEIIETMTDALARQRRIEVRGFGAFSINILPPRTGRNPRTGESVELGERRSPHFKPGKGLRESVQAAAPLKASDKPRQ